MPQIKCTDLTLGYGSQEILSHLSFEVNAGDYLCIVGENGSGKTTLMKTLLGLTKPLKGSIEFSDGVTARTRSFSQAVWVMTASVPFIIRRTRPSPRARWSA